MEGIKRFVFFNKTCKQIGRQNLTASSCGAPGGQEKMSLGSLDQILNLSLSLRRKKEMARVCSCWA